MRVRFEVAGMTCAACSARVEKVTRAVSGVQKAEVNLLAGTMQTELETEDCVQQIIQAITNAGYSASVARKANESFRSKCNKDTYYCFRCISCSFNVFYNGPYACAAHAVLVYGR